MVLHGHYDPTRSTLPYLTHTQPKPRRRQLRPTPRKHLRSRLNALQIQSRTQLIVRLEILVKRQQISRERRRGLALRYKGVHDGVAVVPDDEVEGRAVDGWSGGGSRRVAVVGERRGAAVVAEPDHDFVGLRAGGGGAEEGVVGDVGDEGGADVAVERGLMRGITIGVMREGCF